MSFRVKCHGSHFEPTLNYFEKYIDLKMSSAIGRITLQVRISEFPQWFGIIHKTLLFFCVGLQCPICKGEFHVGGGTILEKPSVPVNVISMLIKVATRGPK